MLIKAGILIFDISFYLTFINILNSVFYNSKQYFKFFKSSNFCFPKLYVVNICSKRSVKWRKSINEMGGNIPGGNFPGGIFPGVGGRFS